MSEPNRSCVLSIPQLEYPITHAVAAVGRGDAIACDVPPQHISAVTAGPRPHANDAVFRYAAKGDVFGRRSRGERDALPKAVVIETLLASKRVCVTIGGPRKAGRPCCARKELTSRAEAEAVKNGQASPARAIVSEADFIVCTGVAPRPKIHWVNKSIGAVKIDFFVMRSTAVLTGRF